MAAISISSLTSFFSDESSRIQRGENHYKSGHIESCYYSDGIIRGSVQASMKNKSYKVTINLHGSEISSTQCNCPRGEYKCSHAAALAIYCIHNISRTDVQCEWKKQKGPDKTKPVEEIYPSPKDYICLKREVTDE
ncbi:uncharacterized protein LOC111320231 [Stylophora pistillata]|uniref:uncharacterized protein LOC111320231 n=1 Tax=Stylophora pistillata TaxID=50429 RepID=UPI000C04595D|nr:uncharacterized protein LOC111320231 [Stylophora pistillata]